MSSIDGLLHVTRGRLRRLEPKAAAAAMAEGALLVDTRPLELRERDGHVPGALVIGRNVLEWRLDPSSPDRHPASNHWGRTIIVMCDEGYASSLAAGSLQDIGLANATDLVGGFQAWVAAGLPVVRPFLAARYPVFAQI